MYRVRIGALIVLLGLVVVAIIILLLVVGGIVSQSDTWAHLAAALDKIEGWLKNAGISSSGAEGRQRARRKARPGRSGR